MLFTVNPTNVANPPTTTIPIRMTQMISFAEAQTKQESYDNENVEIFAVDYYYTSSQYSSLYRRTSV